MLDNPVWLDLSSAIMAAKYKPLPVPIPTDYTAALGLKEPSFIHHVNAGRRRFRDDQVFALLEAAKTDSRLAGLSVLDLRQEIAPFLDHICKLCPREQKKTAKKRNRRAHAQQ